MNVRSAQRLALVGQPRKSPAANGLRWEHTGKGCARRARAEAIGSGERSAYRSAHDPRGVPVASRGSGLIRVKSERIGLGPGVAVAEAWRLGVGLFPADEIGPCIVHPSCRLTALSHGVVDLASFKADVAQHAVVQTGQGPHGAA